MVVLQRRAGPEGEAAYTAELAELRAQYGDGPQVIEIRERSTDGDAVPPQAQAAWDASRLVAGRAEDVIAERQRADGRADIASPDREAAAASARAAAARARAASLAAAKLKSRARDALAWLGPEALRAADHLLSAESQARRIFVASQGEYEAIMHAHALLRAGDLDAPAVQALIERVESRYDWK